MLISFTRELPSAERPYKASIVSEKGRRKPIVATLDTTDGGFNWTKEELDDAARVAMDRLYLGSTELDEHMPNGQKLHQIERKVKREQKLIDEAVYEAMKARYR